MYWERLTTKTFKETVLNHIDTAILPTGSVEAHGQHCPLGTDNYAPEHFAEALEARYADRLLVLPVIPFGHTWELSVYPGTVSVPSRVFTDYVASVGQSVASWGIKNLIIMNGHGGNTGPLNAAMEEIAEHGVQSVLINWWLDYSREIRTVTEGQGHAGEDETSVMLALVGEYVKMEDASFNPYVPRYKVRARGLEDKTLRHATTGDGRLGTRDKGDKIIELVTDRMSQLLEDVWSDRLFDRKD